MAETSDDPTPTTSAESLRRTHSVAMAMVNDLNGVIGELMALRNREGDRGRAAWDELERRTATDEPSAERVGQDRGDGVGLRHSSADTSGGGGISPDGPIPADPSAERVAALEALAETARWRHHPVYRMGHAWACVCGVLDCGELAALATLDEHA